MSHSWKCSFALIVQPFSKSVVYVLFEKEAINTLDAKGENHEL
ncbi:MAG: hypothetical protein PHX56_08915 [Atribacterota bacterium]|nr:hypothetical protein [Atribacterota bacterium]